MTAELDELRRKLAERDVRLAALLKDLDKAQRQADECVIEFGTLYRSTLERCEHAELKLLQLEQELQRRAQSGVTTSVQLLAATQRLAGCRALADELEATNAVLQRAVRRIADMTCTEHADDEHTPDCGVGIARAALKKIGLGE